MIRDQGRWEDVVPGEGKKVTDEGKARKGTVTVQAWLQLKIFKGVQLGAESCRHCCRDVGVQPPIARVCGRSKSLLKNWKIEIDVSSWQFYVHTPLIYLEVNDLESQLLKSIN